MCSASFRPTLLMRGSGYSPSAVAILFETRSTTRFVRKLYDQCPRSPRLQRLATSCWGDGSAIGIELIQARR